VKEKELAGVMTITTKRQYDMNSALSAEKVQWETISTKSKNYSDSSSWQNLFIRGRNSNNPEIFHGLKLELQCTLSQAEVVCTASCLFLSHYILNSRPCPSFHTWWSKHGESTICMTFAWWFCTGGRKWSESTAKLRL